MTPTDANRYPSINFDETELRLGLPGGRGVDAEIPKSKSYGKRGFSDTEIVDLKLHLSSSSTDKDESVKPPAKAQVVGWPPVRTFRKKAMTGEKANTESETSTALVKVSKDGAPYLRKVDLNMYKSYEELSRALSTMFSFFASEEKDLIRDCKLITYEDKDGDWMLVGDVPWEMFAESCKRMRIMTKGSEAVNS